MRIIVALVMVDSTTGASSSRVPTSAVYWLVGAHAIGESPLAWPQDPDRLLLDIEPLQEFEGGEEPGLASKMDHRLPAICSGSSWSSGKGVVSRTLGTLAFLSLPVATRCCLLPGKTS